MSPLRRSLFLIPALALVWWSASGPRSDGPRWVAPDGDDGAAGTVEAPWRTLARGVRDLEPGDTLFLRGGTYRETEIELDLQGTAAAPITIRNHAGEVPVIDGAFAQFRTAPNEDWEIVDTATGLYRSVATFPGAKQVFGYLGEQDGGYRLVPYEDLGPLRTANEDHCEEPPHFYCGPGVHWHEDDQRIYVRLQRSRYQERLGLRVPRDTDPRNTPLVLFPERDLLDVAGSTAHVVLEGLALQHGDKVLHVRGGCRNLTVRRCELLGGRYEIVVRGGAHDLRFDGLTVHGRFPPWVARSDVKRPEGAAPAHLLQGAAIILVGNVRGVEVAGSSFADLFDVLDATDDPADLHVHHNVMSGIRDDVLQLGSAGHGLDFHHNRITRSAASVSWHGSGAPPSGRAGTKYVHHNVIDTSALHLFGRDDPQGLLPAKWRGPAGDGMATGRAFGSHLSDEITGPDPWKIYHNTIVLAQDVDGSGSGASYPYGPFDPAVPHEVFNNVFVQTADDHLVQGARIDDGSQVFDGNLWFRSAADASEDLFEDLAADGDYHDYATLAAFLASPEWPATKEHYAPGWEAAGVAGDPGLDEAFRPAPDGPAASGAVDLAGRGWPGLCGERFRGALAPR